jgi:hypothetical protein
MHSVSARDLALPAVDADAILQVKVWLVGISPMIWRRVLVPAAFSLRELHGMGEYADGGVGTGEVGRRGAGAGGDFEIIHVAPA